MPGEPVVLLVEDDPNDVALFRRGFDRTGVRANLQVLNDGEEAVSYLEGRGAYADRDRYPLPVVMLLDLKLPRRSGTEVLEWLRKQPKMKRLPVVVMTSSRQAANVNRAYELGANSYLVKPMGTEALLNAIRFIDEYWLRLNQPPDLANRSTG